MDDGWLVCLVHTAQFYPRHHVFLVCLGHFMQELSSTSGECDPLCSVDDTSSLQFEENYQPKTDLLKAVAIFAAAITGTIAINHSWVAANQVCLFCYFSIHEQEVQSCLQL